MKPTSETRMTGREPVQAGIALTAAIVSAGNVDTPYHRLGHGPPVVVLGLWSNLDARAIPLDLLTLGASCRIIVPDLERVGPTASPVGPVAASFGGWLSGFLDGLGLASATMIASWVMEEQLIDVLGSLSGRIDRIVIVGGAVARPRVTPYTGTAPVLIWRAGNGPSWADVGRFLAGQEPWIGKPPAD